MLIVVKTSGMYLSINQFNLNLYLFFVLYREKLRRIFFRKSFGNNRVAPSLNKPQVQEKQFIHV